MKLVSLLHNNFYYTSDLTDLAARSTPLQFSYLLNDEEHWHQKMSNDYVKNLNDYITKLSFGFEDVAGISDQDIADMVDVLKNYTKAQKGAYLSFQNFFSENDQIKQRYTNHLIGEEGLYDDNAEHETIHMQGIFNIPNDSIKNGIDSYIVRVMLSFDNPTALNAINHVKDYDESHKLMTDMIANGSFKYQVDIKRQQDDGLVMVATYNNTNGILSEQNILTNNAHNNFLLYQLNDAMGQDANTLVQFSKNNAAFNDFYKQFEFISGILKNCKTDNLMNPVTSESIIGFKAWINEQKIEKEIASTASLSHVVDMLNKIRDNSNNLNNGKLNNSINNKKPPIN